MGEISQSNDQVSNCFNAMFVSDFGVHVFNRCPIDAQIGTATERA
jgi:hypothetical protein